MKAQGSLCKYTHQNLCFSNVASDPDRNILSRHKWRALEAFMQMRVTELRKGQLLAQKVGGTSSAQYVSCKVFHDWSII